MQQMYAMGNERQVRAVFSGEMNEGQMKKEPHCMLKQVANSDAAMMKH